ncbi:hypothetical protein AB1M95_07090 [Sulfitobacter sp. LCG007]
MLDTPLNHFKSVFAHKFFVAPADRNYFFARFSKAYGINEEFWWQALQTIEKLFKAGLVLIGVSVKSEYGHDIKKLWCKHKEVFEDLAVTELRKPNKLPERWWTASTLENFIDRVEEMGQPGSRYGLISYSNEKGDLFKFDQLVFELRRRTIGMDWIVGEHFKDEPLKEFKGQLYRNIIAQCPDRQIRSMETPKGSFAMIGKEMDDVVHSWNFRFLRNDTDLEPPPTWPVASGFSEFGYSYLYLLLKELRRTEITRVEIEQIEWLLENINIGKDDEKKIKSIREAAAEA